MAAEEDKVLFGSINALISDELYNRIDAALLEGVASLPLMTVENSGEPILLLEDRRDQVMLKLLRTSYNCYVDLFDMYGARNIFTVADRTAHFRKRVVEAFQQCASDHRGDDREQHQCTAENIAGSQQGHPNSFFSYDISSLCMPKSASDIPSLDAMGVLEEQIRTEQNKLRETHEMSTKEERRCQDLEDIAHFSQESNITLAKVQVDGMPAAVRAYLDGKEQLKLSKHQASKLLQTMEDLIRNKIIEDGVNDPDASHTLGSLTHTYKSSVCNRPKSLEEEYREDRSVAGDTSLQDLRQINQMLQRTSEKLKLLDK